MRTGTTGKATFVGVMALAIAALGGCGGDETMTGPPTPPAGRTVKATPSLATDIQEIFNRRGCSQGSCHGTSASAGLELGTPSASFTSLVGVTATSEAIIRVVPNDADNSYLVIRLEGRQTVGQQMPLGGTQLDTIDMNNIKNWINTGAANN